MSPTAAKVSDENSVEKVLEETPQASVHGNGAPADVMDAEENDDVEDEVGGEGPATGECPQLSLSTNGWRLINNG